MYWFSSWNSSRYVNHYLCCISINNKRVCKKLSSTIKNGIIPENYFFSFQYRCHCVNTWSSLFTWYNPYCLLFDHCGHKKFQSLLVLTIAVCGLTVHMLPAPRLLTDWCNVSLCRRCTLYTPLYTVHCTAVQLFARTIRDPLIICWPYTHTTRKLRELLCPAHAMPLLSFCKSFTVSRHTANSQASIL